MKRKKVEIESRLSKDHKIEEENITLDANSMLGYDQPYTHNPSYYDLSS